MGTFRTFAMYAGAVICLGGLIFAGIRMMTGRFHYKAGSPEHGIVDNSTVTVLAVDAKVNRLTVAMRDGSEASYNPALLKKLRFQSHVFRVETREISKGERIRLTNTAQEFHLRKGDFATVERISEDRSLSLRSDQGKSAVLSEEQSRKIDHDYATERMPLRGVDRVIVSGEATQLATMQKDFARLSGQTRDLAIYTSDGQGLAREKVMQAIEVTTPGIQSEMNLNVSVPAPDIAMEGFSRGR